MIEPFVSVIMPIRNEQRTVESSLRSVLGQEYPPQRMEIIVVDGISTDRTREIILWLGKSDRRIRLMDNHDRIMAAGFNQGLSVARGTIIVMLGGHAELAPNYLRACTDVLKKGLADCVGGPITTVSGAGIAEAIRISLSCPFGVGGPAFRRECSEPKYVDTVAFGAYTRDIINRAGILDEELTRNQDDEYNYRIRKLGGRILLIPNTSSRYVVRSSLRLLWKQYFQYGLWKVRVFQKHPFQMQLRHFVPALFVFTLLSSGLLSAFLGISKGAFVLAVVLYAAASIIVSAVVARKARRRALLPSLPIVFATLHFAYGIGFLTGLILFINRFRDQRTPSISEVTGKTGI